MLPAPGAEHLDRDVVHAVAAIPRGQQYTRSGLVRGLRAFEVVFMAFSEVLESPRALYSVFSPAKCGPLQVRKIWMETSFMRLLLYLKTHSERVCEQNPLRHSTKYSQYSVSKTCVRGPTRNSPGALRRHLPMSSGPTSPEGLFHGIFASQAQVRRASAPRDRPLLLGAPEVWIFH